MASDYPFFGGDATDMGHVRALPVKTFKDLVDQSFNVAVPLNLTKRQFLELPDKERNRRKMVPYLTPAKFSQNPSPRKTAYAESVSLVFLDIDTVYNKEKTEIIARPAKPYYSDPTTLYDHLEGLNFVLYETAQSTPENPRLRVMVEADGFSPDHYRKAVQYVAKRIGLAHVTPESGVVVQAMFRPTIFAGQVPELEHPMLASRTDASPLRLRDFIDEDVDPLSIEKDPGKPATDGIDVSGDALEYLRPPVEQVTLEAVKEALSHVDPDISYREWLEIAAALRHQFPRDLAEDAYTLFDEWSAKGQKYVGADDTAAKWNSLKPTPLGRVPVTIRSLLHRATLAGWDNAPVRQECFKSTRDWIRHCPTLQLLLSGSLGRIIATPLLSKLEEEGLLNEIIRKAKDDFEHKVGIATIRKELKILRANVEAAKAKEKEKESTRVPNWAKGLAYISAADEFFRSSTGAKYKPAALDRSFSKYLLPSDEQLEAAGNSGNIAAQSKPIIPPQDFLLNNVKIPTAYDYVYDPRQPNETFISVDGKTCVNVYARTYPEPDPESSGEAGKLFQAHLSNLIAEPLYQRLILDWLAHLVQFPGRKVRWAILIQGAEGCGKTFIHDAMTAVIGLSNTKVVDPGAVFQGWNEWAFGHQLVTLEEIRVTGKNRHEVMNKIKPLVTNKIISINERFRNQRQVENMSNYLLFTNHHDALALSSHDRRFMVVKSPLQNEKQVAALGGKSYFEKLFQMLEMNAAGLRHFFEVWPISPDFPANGPAPRTKYHEQMQADTMNETEVQVREYIADGEYALIQPDLLSLTTLTNRLELEGKSQVTPQRLGSILRELGYNRGERVTIKGERHVLWVHGESGLDGLDLGGIALARLNRRASEADEIFSS